MKFKWETEFKETEIGKIPKDWEVKKIGDIARINEENINKNYPHKVIEYIDINSVEEGTILERKYIPLDSAPTRARRIVRDEDILLSTEDQIFDILRLLRKQIQTQLHLLDLL